MVEVVREDLTKILRDLGYYDQRVLEEGDRLVGTPCLRNNCTEFKVGDRVDPILYSTQDSRIFEHRAMHAVHHEQAIAVVQEVFGGSRTKAD